MILDSERQRELLLQIVRSGQFDPSAYEAIGKLWTQIQEADVDSDADCEVERLLESVAGGD